jgi:hypothetical protein
MYFITFRLTNSLPRAVIRELQAWRERERARILSQLQGREQTEKLYKLSKNTSVILMLGSIVASLEVLAG